MSEMIDKMNLVLEALFEINLRYLVEHPEHVGRSSAIEYRLRIDDALCDAATITKRGYAEIDELACLRAAELFASGKDMLAKPVMLKGKTTSGVVFYTCGVARGDGTMEMYDGKEHRFVATREPPPRA